MAGNERDGCGSPIPANKHENSQYVTVIELMAAAQAFFHDPKKSCSACSPPARSSANK
jgi:hypothetical protein